MLKHCTNISTAQLVGLNGDVFGDTTLVGIAWEAFARVTTALIFLPRYLASSFTTTPAFLEKRFDKTTSSMVSGLFFFGYVTVLFSIALYTGSLVLKEMFSLEIKLDTLVPTIDILGSAYAIFGGLKSFPVSDTINGLGLLIGGLSIPFLALIKLGKGSFINDSLTIYKNNLEYLSVLTQTNMDDKTVTFPWLTLLTEMENCAGVMAILLVL